jgi:hypothetical protein
VGVSQRGCELRTPVKRVRALARLDLRELGSDLEPFDTEMAMLVPLSVVSQFEFFATLVCWKCSTAPSI